MRARAVVEAALIFVGRFGVMALVLALIPGLGWFAGLVTNVVLCGCALALTARWRLWGRAGGLRPPDGHALAWLGLFTLSALLWLVPDGVESRPPGSGWWALTMAAVGLNEELFGRVIVLARLRSAFGPAASAAISAVLFGLQHLSALVLTDRAVLDVLENVVLAGAFGFAYAAFQLRFSWVWPLAALHALGDYVMTLAVRPPPDAVIVLQHAVLVAGGVMILAGRHRGASGGAPRRGAASPDPAAPSP